MMGFYRNQAFKFFGKYSEKVLELFPDLKIDLKKADMKISSQEYISIALFTIFLLFLILFPTISLFFGLLTGAFLFSFISAFTTSLATLFLTFIFFLNYPKFVKGEKAKEIEKALPFASLYLSTVTSSRLPLHTSFKLFSKFSGYGKIAEEINKINQDVELFGLDINTALEREIDRSPSKSLGDLLWGVLSVSRAGGDINAYLKQKSSSFIEEYRRKLYEFSHSLALYVEMYLTAIVLGTVFFTILSAIVAGIAGAAKNIVLLQAFLIFIFTPLIGITFLFLVKRSTPAGE
jgi:flagellar protein FlaJ